MERLKMHSPNLAQENVARIRELFPGCVTEAPGADGQIRLAVDFDQLRQELSECIVEGPQERYHLNWPGKREALLAANLPITKTLRSCREESVDFDNTKNLFIEGDNLEALKLLQESYLGKVKMIYIDPPYNTGNDFIYRDNFAEVQDEFLARTNQKDEEGNRLVANSETNGKFHSNWLSMMYPRLKLARNILRDDGIIFISIDDSEASALKTLCDEIFGRVNYYCTFVWRRRSGAMDAVNNVSSDHEYVLCYGKRPGRLNGVKRTFERYSNPDNDPRGPWIEDNLSAGKPGGNTNYPIQDPLTGNKFWPPKGRYWPYSPETMSQKIKEGRIIFPKSRDGAPLLKRFQNEAKSEVLPISTWGADQKSGASNSFKTSLNTEGTKEIKNLFGDKVFTFPKPTVLIKSLLQQGSDTTAIVVDFFAGSGTTADAVMQQNAEDGGNRKFILVQMPEPCDADTVAFNAGFNTIADVAKERIRRAGRKILEKDCHSGWRKDVGFRTLKIDTSNFIDVHSRPDAINQAQLELYRSNIKPDRLDYPEDLLLQALLDHGVELSLPIRTEFIHNKRVFFVADNSLIACFDDGVHESLIRELAKYKPVRAVFLDRSFASDADKINAEQIFKQLSPDTEVRSI